MKQLSDREKLTLISCAMKHYEPMLGTGIMDYFVVCISDVLDNKINYIPLKNLNDF